MKSVNVSTLKAHLSEFISRARRGEEILILDRHTPVAKIVRVSPADAALDQRGLLQRLAAEGVVRTPLRHLADGFLDDMPAVQGSAVADLLADRRESL